MAGGATDFSTPPGGGGRYNPTGDSWTAVILNSAVAPRTGHTAVWTGSGMIVWGGYVGAVANTTSTGGRYDPFGNSWTAITLTGVPAARRGHTAVWTGSEMIVWGGANNDLLNDTFSYTPGRMMHLYQRP